MWSVSSQHVCILELSVVCCLVDIHNYISSNDVVALLTFELHMYSTPFFFAIMTVVLCA